MSPLSGHKEQRSINGIAYHRGAALVRLHPTGFCTALIPLLETTKRIRLTNNHTNNSIMQCADAETTRLFPQLINHTQVIGNWLDKGKATCG